MDVVVASISTLCHPRVRPCARIASIEPLLRHYDIRLRSAADLGRRTGIALPHPVDLATATFDPLNALLTRADLFQALRRVAQNLRPGGHFIFDFLTCAYSPAEMADCLLRAGFRIRGVHEADSLGPATHCAPRLIVVAQYYAGRLGSCRPT